VLSYGPTAKQVLSVPTPHHGKTMIVPEHVRMDTEPAWLSAAKALARAHVLDSHDALSTWPRCIRCSTYIPTHRALKAIQTGHQATYCSRYCRESFLEAAYRRRRRAQERLGAALEPTFLTAVEVSATILPPPTVRVACYQPSTGGTTAVEVSARVAARLRRAGRATPKA